MFWRFFITLLCLASLAGYLDHAHREGRLQQVDDLFLDFLVANARDRFEKPEREGRVVLVEMREEERKEYADWPPPPLDWQTLLKSLRSYQPEVLLIATPLNWGDPTPDFVPAVTEALLPFPSVVLGADAALGKPGEPAAALPPDLETVLPRFSHVDGDAEGAPALSAPVFAPLPSVRASVETGLACAREDKGDWLLPYAVRVEDGGLLPTVLAQAVARHSRTPYSNNHRLRLGPGAGAYLASGGYVPLEPNGDARVKKSDVVPTVNALHLMAGGLADTMPAADLEHLKQASVIVVGTAPAADQEPTRPALASLYARALQRLLALPSMRVLTEGEQWLAWGIAATAALWIVMRVRRSKALKAGLALIFAALVVSLLLFQSNLLWCPPTLPGALIAAGALLGRFFGRVETVPAAATVPQEDAAPVQG